MDIISFINQHTLQDILLIEAQDQQLQVIQRAWQAIRTKHGEHDSVKHAFLYVLLQTALISYQIAGSGPLRRTEITQKIEKDFDHLHASLLDSRCVSPWRLQTMISSQYNKRIYNIKSQRIAKFFAQYDQYFHIETTSYHDFYHDMAWLVSLLATSMKQKITNKTITFAVKIFGYGARTVYDQLRHYPMNIRIPLDSRLRTIGKQQWGELSDKQYQEKFQLLAEKFTIPPLHLDSLIWLKYREKVKQ